MTKKFNADEAVLTSEITINGRVYTPKITTAKLKRLQEIAKEAPGDPDAVLRQLACLLDADPGEFKDLDFRKAVKVCEFLLQDVSGASAHIEKPKQ